MQKNKMKNICLFVLLSAVYFATGCNLTHESTVSANKTNNSEIAKTENSAVPNVLINSASTDAPLLLTNKNVLANAEKVQTNEPLPRKIDDDTAVSPVYGINSKNCQNKDEQGSEGDEFVRKCRGYGDYSLWASGFDEQITYRIEANDLKADFLTYLAPLEGEDADEYRRADHFVQKLADKIEWILDEQGKPYAIFVHAYFYKNTGSVKNSVSPKNKVAEFVLLRGLKGFKEIDSDIQTADTAYNPDEWARKIAYEVREKQQKN